MSVFTKPANETFAPYDSAGMAREIVPQEAQVWGTEVERLILGFQAGGGIIFETKAQMDASLAYAANQQAWVMGDPVVGNNGIYRKFGASGTGSWQRLGDLPYSFIKATDIGAGTPNAIQAATSIPVSESALIWTNVFESNTASPVTISFNGGSALTIKAFDGADILADGLTAGMVVGGFISGATFRLISDQSRAALIAAINAAVTAAQNAEQAAEAAQAAAEDAAETAAGLVVDLVSQGNVPIFDSRDTVALYDMANFNTVIINKFNSTSNVAPAHYVKVAQPANVEPTSPLKFQSADGYWFRMSASRLDLSACGDTLDAAIDNAVAHASVPTIMELTADMTMASEATVPKEWVFRITAGRVILNGHKLNLQGNVKAPWRKVFNDDGGGSVVGIKRPFLYWWGGKADWNGFTGTDCSPALQKAIVCVQSPETGSSDGHGHPAVKAGGGSHKLASPVIFNPALGSPTGLEGNGVMLGTASGTRFASMISAGICIYVAASYLPSEDGRLCSYRFRHFVVDEAYGTGNATYGMHFGDAGIDAGDPNNGSRMLDSAATLNVIEGVHVREFLVNVQMTNVRNVLITNCQFESKAKIGKSLAISVTKSGKFSGEIVVDRNVVLIQPANQGTALEISIPSTITADAEIRGIKILTGGIYGGQYKVNIDIRSNATYKAYAGHFWYDNGYQLDAGFVIFSDYGLYMQSHGPNSRIEEIDTSSPYFSGITVCGIWGQQVNDGTGFGTIQAVSIRSPKFNYCVNELVHFEGGRGITIDGAQIYDCGNSASTATRYFYFNSVTDFSVTLTKRIKNDPVAWPGGTITKGVQIDGASDRYVVRGNSFLTTTPVNDNVSATNRDVAANW
jgi:hypothetical protein